MLENGGHGLERLLLVTCCRHIFIAVRKEHITLSTSSLSYLLLAMWHVNRVCFNSLVEGDILLLRATLMQDRGTCLVR
jgi:hypothetical protein